MRPSIKHTQTHIPSQPTGERRTEDIARCEQKHNLGRIFRVRLVPPPRVKRDSIPTFNEAEKWLFTESWFGAKTPARRVIAALISAASCPEHRRSWVQCHADGYAWLLTVSKSGTKKSAWARVILAKLREQGQVAA